MGSHADGVTKFPDGHLIHREDLHEAGCGEGDLAHPVRTSKKPVTDWVQLSTPTCAGDLIQAKEYLTMIYECREFLNFRSFREYRNLAINTNPEEEKKKRLKERLELHGFLQEALARRSDLGFDYAVYLNHGGPEAREQIMAIMDGAIDL